MNKLKFILMSVLSSFAIYVVVPKVVLAVEVKRNIFEPVISSTHNDKAKLLKVVPIYYANVDDVHTFLMDKKYQFLSKTGLLKVDKRLRQLWIKDDAEHVKIITDVVKQLDVPNKQVLIKARIVNIDTHSLRMLGLNFTTHVPNKTQEGFMMDLPNATAGQMIFPIAKLKTGAMIDLQLSALEQTGQAQILAKPELTTLNHETAFIQSGEEVPYEEKTQSGGTSITFKKAALQLRVTPEVLPNNKILLKLSVDQDKISAINIAGTPAIHTQKIKTQVLVNNQQTIALGGIFEEMNDQSHKNIPFFSKLPLLGFFFRHHSRAFEHKELIVFVTSSILRDKR